MLGGICRDATFGWGGGRDVARADGLACVPYRLVRFPVRSPIAPRNIIIY
jgi:hypothetical protein